VEVFDMPKRFVKVALCQRSSSGTKEHNLEETLKMIEEAVANCRDLDVIAFPEYNYRDTTCEDVGKSAEPIPGPYTDAIAELAKKHNVNIIPGSMVEARDGKRHRNTVPFINRDGLIIGKYSKVHLFDAVGCKESDKVEPGDQVVVVDADFGKVGLMVCYDLRFPDFAKTMVLMGADIIVCPAAFPTGAKLPPRTDHWDVLVASTALYNQTYVCAVNLFGTINNEIPFGRSSVIDPWGTAVASASNKTCIVYATLDMEYQKAVKEKLATWQNRRPDLYKL
jgi:predicted amidohydrolase